MTSRPELRGQTALRGVAALVVVIAHGAFFHFFPRNYFAWQFCYVFFWHNEAVDLFFELSGFILCYVYLNRAFKWRDYFVARFARIYPVYVASVLLALALIYYDFILGRGAGQFTPAALISNLLLVQQWPLIGPQPSFDIPTWSISVEIFLYIFTFPCLCLLNKYLGFWAKIVLVVLPVVASSTTMCLTWGINSEGMDAIWNPFNLWRGILCFTSGFFTCSAGLMRSFPRVLSRKGEIIFLLVTMAALMLQFPFNRKVAVLCFPLLAYLSAQNGSILTQALGGRFFAWLGDLSYSIYVWHWALLHLVVMALTRLNKITHYGFWDAGVIVILCSVVLVFGVSHVSHFYFERPANKWIRRKLSRADPLPVSMR